MKMTVYLPDDLAAEVKKLDDLNVSGVLQAALRTELARRKAAEALREYIRNIEIGLASLVDDQPTEDDQQPEPTTDQGAPGEQPQPGQ